MYVNVFHMVAFIALVVILMTLYGQEQIHCAIGKAVVARTSTSLTSTAKIFKPSKKKK